MISNRALFTSSITLKKRCTTHHGQMCLPTYEQVIRMDGQAFHPMNSAMSENPGAAELRSDIFPCLGVCYQIGTRKIEKQLFNVSTTLALSLSRMASTLRKLKTLVLSQTTDTEQIANLLDTVSVPLHTGDCRSCPDPCTEGNGIRLLPALRLLHER